MNIAVVIPKYNLGGGAEYYCAELTGLLSGRGNYFHVFANRWRTNSDRISFHKIPVLNFPKFLTTASFAYFARSEIRKSPFDLVHAHDRVFEADIFTMHGIPHRLWVREVRKKRMPSLFDHATAWTERYLIKNGGCRKFLAVSSLTRELFTREYPEVDPDKIEVVHPGIDIEIFKDQNPGRSRSELEREFGFQAEERVILFVSMNFDIKGLDFVLGGLSRLKLLRPSEKWKLLVVGKGETERYARRAAGLDIGDRVVFAGVRPKESLNAIYAGCDLFAMPSKFDTFGMTVLEAMAASLPVMISNTVGAKDLVTQGLNGFILEKKENADELAGRFEAMMDRETRIKMGQEAFKTARVHTWNEVAQKMERVYREVFEQKRRREK